MGEGDGGVLLDVRVNPNDAGKEFDKLSKKAVSLEEKLARGKAQLKAATDEAARLGAQLDAAKVKQAQMEASGMTTTDQLKTQKETVASLQAQFNSAAQRVDRMTPAVEKTNTELTATKEKAAQVAKEMGKGAPILDKMGTDAKRLEKRLMGLAKRVLIFSVFTAGLRSLRSWFFDVIKTDKKAVAAIAQLKGALLTLVQPLVGVVIPAFTTFVQALTQMVSALATVMSAVFGTTADESAAAAENLNDEKTALNGVGAAAKKAGKDLAGFDEINKIGETAGSGSKVIAPDFSALKEVPEWVKNLVSDLNFTIKDLFFDFDDLTEEDILAKVVAGLTTLTGTVLGFATGGSSGALLGTIAGVALSLLITNLTFDGDGKISQEEIAKLLISALSMLAGGVLGFMAGGPGGAFLGVTAGAGIALELSSLIFNNDNVLSAEEIAKLLISALFMLAGGILGFMAGGPGGALLGITVGAGVALGLSDLIFNNDNVLSAEEIAQGLSAVLGALAGGIVGFIVGGPGGALIGMVVGAGITLGFAEAIFNNDGVMSPEEVLSGIASMLFALAGGIVGFFVGGPAGAALGAMIGFGAVALFSSMIFNNDGVLSQSEITMGLCTVLGALIGGIIGFFVGGPGGALLGATIGAGAVVMLTNLITEKGGEANKDKFLKGLAAVLGALLGGIIGFVVGGPGGALLGAVIGLGISLAVSSVDTSKVDKAVDKAKKQVGSNYINGTMTVTGGTSYAPGLQNRRSAIPSIDSSDIPHFAKGAVIPANREFAAILGDQTHGNNLEGPEDLFRKIVREESGANDMNSAGVLSVLQQILDAVKEGKILMVDDDVFARVIHEASARENSRQGMALVTVG